MKHNAKKYPNTGPEIHVYVYACIYMEITEALIRNPINRPIFESYVEEEEGRKKKCMQWQKNCEKWTISSSVNVCDGGRRPEFKKKKICVGF